MSVLGLHPKIRRSVGRAMYLRGKRVELPNLVSWQGSADLEPLLFDESNWHLTYSDGEGGFVP